MCPPIAEAIFELYPIYGIERLLLPIFQRPECLASDSLPLRSPTLLSALVSPVNFFFVFFFEAEDFIE
jgi:hypothetical protein